LEYPTKVNIGISVRIDSIYTRLYILVAPEEPPQPAERDINIDRHPILTQAPNPEFE
jgi:hypothetical protein